MMLLKLLLSMEAENLQLLAEHKYKIGKQTTI